MISFMTTSRFASPEAKSQLDAKPCQGNFYLLLGGLQIKAGKNIFDQPLFF
jgi:hypothetical protein